MTMINWLDTPQSFYVIVAYGLALACLALLLALSWYEARKAAKTWQTIEGQRQAKDQG